MTLFKSLNDVRVLDLSLNMAGPTCGMILADLGADVIKVEHPERGDDTRSFPPSWDGKSVVFMACNRNKRSVGIDYKSEQGKAEALRLAASADVVIESFRPGTTDKLGLGYEDLKETNPQLIYCSISAFGRGEAGKGLPGYDPLIQAFSGIMASTGHPGQEPARVAASLIDLSTGLWAATGILAAINERVATGQGQLVEATLVDTGYALMCHQMAGFLANGTVPEPLGSASPITAPYEAFQTSDGWVMIAAGNDSLFHRLCDAIGRPELKTDDSFLKISDRTGNRRALHEQIEGVLLTDTAAAWIQKIGEAGVPIGPVNDVGDALAHPIAEERSTLQSTDDPGIPEDLRLVRMPLTSNGETAPAMRRPPELREHDDEVLGGEGDGGWNAAGLGTVAPSRSAA